MNQRRQNNKIEMNDKLDEQLSCQLNNHDEILRVKGIVSNGLHLPLQGKLKSLIDQNNSDTG